jgi:hypothetical protein
VSRATRASRAVGSRYSDRNECRGRPRLIHAQMMIIAAPSVPVPRPIPPQPPKPVPPQPPQPFPPPEPPSPIPQPPGPGIPSARGVPRVSRSVSG